MTKQEKAVELALKLKIYKPYIQDLKKGYRTLFENYAGFSIGKWEQELELLEKINEIEKENNCYVYAVTHEMTEFGEIYDMLIIPNDEDEWDTIIDDAGNGKFYVFAFVWNKDYEPYSDWGDITIQSAVGGIKRIG